MLTTYFFTEPRQAEDEENRTQASGHSKRGMSYTTHTFVARSLQKKNKQKKTIFNSFSYLQLEDALDQLPRLECELWTPLRISIWLRQAGILDPVNTLTLAATSECSLLKLHQTGNAYSVSTQ